METRLNYPVGKCFGALEVEASGVWKLLLRTFKFDLSQMSEQEDMGTANHVLIVANSYSELDPIYIRKIQKARTPRVFVEVQKIPPLASLLVSQGEFCVATNRRLQRTCRMWETSKTWRELDRPSSGCL